MICAASCWPTASRRSFRLCFQRLRTVINSRVNQRDRLGGGFMDSGIYQKWIEDIDALSEAQRKEVQAILAGRSSEAEVIAALEGRTVADRVCPLCQRPGAVCRGRATGLRRFYCAGCGKTFNATGTPLANLHYKGRWYDFARSLSAGESVRKSAARCDVAVSTAFGWRIAFCGRSTPIRPLSAESSRPTKPMSWKAARYRGPGKMPPRAARCRGAGAQAPQARRQSHPARPVQ